jgi:c-di-GMP-binding flagellar brake protein YcgR
MAAAPNRDDPHEKTRKGRDRRMEEVMNSLNVVETGSYTRPMERREHARVKACVQVELRQEGSPAVIRTKTSDISLGGCYVEMMFTLETSSKLNIALWINGERLRCKGVVITRHPQFGNGIQFLDISVEDQQRLRNLLQSPPQ